MVKRLNTILFSLLTIFNLIAQNTEYETNEIESLNKTGYTLLTKKKFSNALCFFNETIKKFPSSQYTYFLRGLTHYLLNNYAEAEKDFYKSINKFEISKYRSNDIKYLLLYIVQHKLEYESDIIIKLNKLKFDENFFIFPIVNLYLTGNNLDKILQKVNNMNNMMKTDFYYFIGIYFSLKNDHSLAQEYFKKCMDLKQDYFFTYLLSEAELKKSINLTKHNFR